MSPPSPVIAALLPETTADDVPVRGGDKEIIREVNARAVSIKRSSETAAAVCNPSLEPGTEHTPQYNWLAEVESMEEVSYVEDEPFAGTRAPPSSPEKGQNKLCLRSRRPSNERMRRRSFAKTLKRAILSRAASLDDSSWTAFVQQQSCVRPSPFADAEFEEMDAPSAGTRLDGYLWLLDRTIFKYRKRFFFVEGDMLFHTAKKSDKRYQATVCGRLTHAMITNQFLYELTFFCNGPRREHEVRIKTQAELDTWYKLVRRVSSSDYGRAVSDPRCSIS